MRGRTEHEQQEEPHERPGTGPGGAGDAPPPDGAAGDRSRLSLLAALEGAQRRERTPRRALDIACRAAVDILERVADAFVAIDDQERIVYVNDRAAALVGRSHEWARGRTLADAFPDGLGVALGELVARARHEPGPIEAEVDLPAMDRWVQLRAFPVDDGLGVYLHDITARRRAEQDREALLAAERVARMQAEEARAIAEAASRTQSEFLATMSHEFRTPLNAFKGYVQLLDLGIAGPVTAQQRDYLTRLSASTEHLLSLVNDVLDVAKADAGRLEVARAPASAAEAVAAALALTRPLADARGVRLVDDCRTCGVDPTYVGDEDRVRQVLVNLLSNAIKFTDGPGMVRVGCRALAEAPPEARVHGTGPWVCLEVQDTGIGIPPEEQAAVFAPFHQVDGGHTRRADGTGLGLAISRRLARLMGGDLTLRSAPGQGSCFALWLRGEGAVDAALDAAAARAGGGPDAPATAGARDAGGGPSATAAAVVGAVVPAALGVPTGLAHIGEALRAELDAVLGSFTARLRADPATPRARGMRQPALEDHVVTLLGDLAQSLVIIADAGDQAAELLRDGSEIERIVADRHGIRRHAQGWSEAEVQREYVVLGEEVARAVRGRLRAPDAPGATGEPEAAAALSALAGFLAHAAAVSVRAWRRAAAESAPDPADAQPPANAAPAAD